jgi:hypothetical protein
METAEGIGNLQWHGSLGQIQGINERKESVTTFATK